jgi:hypothetical protein
MVFDHKTEKIPAVILKIGIAVYSSVFLGKRDVFLSNKRL